MCNLLTGPRLPGDILQDDNTWLDYRYCIWTSLVFRDYQLHQICTYTGNLDGLDWSSMDFRLFPKNRPKTRDKKCDFFYHRIAIGETQKNDKFLPSEDIRRLVFCDLHILKRKAAINPPYTSKKSEVVAVVGVVAKACSKALSYLLFTFWAVFFRVPKRARD